MSCGSCGGGGAAAPASAQTKVFTIMLADGTKVGSFASQEAAEVARRTTYRGAGRVVPK